MGHDATSRIAVARIGMGRTDLRAIGALAPGPILAQELPPRPSGNGAKANAAPAPFDARRALTRRGARPFGIGQSPFAAEVAHTRRSGGKRSDDRIEHARPGPEPDSMAGRHPYDPECVRPFRLAEGGSANKQEC